MRPLVLCYHAVSDAWRHLLCVSPAAFERQLETLIRRGYAPVSAADVLAGEGRRLHVTFDDAFASVRSALPVLERLGVPATIFVCPGFADGGKQLRIPELDADVEAFPAELRTMDWSDLRELAALPGIEIGAHTLSHLHLRRLSDAELAREVVGSRERLEDELGRPCALFAYPYGEHDERIRGAAMSAGFRAAFGLQPRGTSWRDPFRLPRVALWRGEGGRTVAFKTSAVGRSLPVTLLRRVRNAIA